MSRSYKKHKCYKSKDKFYKKYYNKIIRKNDKILYNGNSYKRAYPRWLVIDHRFYFTETEYKDLVNRGWKPDKYYVRK